MATTPTAGRRQVLGLGHQGPHRVRLGGVDAGGEGAPAAAGQAAQDRGHLVGGLPFAQHHLGDAGAGLARQVEDGVGDGRGAAGGGRDLAGGLVGAQVAAGDGVEELAQAFGIHGSF